MKWKLGVQESEFFIIVSLVTIVVIFSVLYSCILAFAFGFIPFAYFYYEEDDENASIKEVFLFLIFKVSIIFFRKYGEDVNIQSF